MLIVKPRLPYVGMGLVMMLLAYHLVTAQQKKPALQAEPKVVLSTKATDSLSKPRPSLSASAPKSESEFYKLMYENEKNSSSKFITLSQWTLGGVLAILLGLLGVQALFNYRINEAKIRQIESDLSVRFLEQNTVFTNRINDEVTSLINSNGQRLHDFENALTTRIDTFIDSINNELTAYFDSSDKKIQENKESILRDVKGLNFQIELIKAENYELKNWDALALSSYVNAASLEGEVHYKPRESSIEKIISLIDKTGEISTLDRDKLVKMIEDKKLSDKAKADIEARLNKVKIYFYDLLGFSGNRNSKKYINKS